MRKSCLETGLAGVCTAQGILTGSGVKVRFVTFCDAFLEDRKKSGMTGEFVWDDLGACQLVRIRDPLGFCWLVLWFTCEEEEENTGWLWFVVVVPPARF